MTKKGYKHKTNTFGEDSEFYASSLFMMVKNPNGYRRPDLTSVNGRYKPRLSLEMKSGRNQKGVLCASQLHYAITTEDDYQEVFGSESDGAGLLPEGSWARLPQADVAYYYGLINRIDDVSARGLPTRLSAVRLQWGDIYIAPHRYGHAAFVAARVCRTGERDIPAVLEDIMDQMKSDVDERCSHYIERRKDRQSWQDIHGRDFLAIFHNDPSLTTKEGRNRVAILRYLYHEAWDIPRIQIPGPNGTMIYIMCEEGHYNIFDQQMRRTVEQRIPIIEQLTKERAAGELLLENALRRQGSLFSEDDASEGEFTDVELDDLEASELKRLCSWREADFVPDQPHLPEEALDTSFDFGANVATEQIVAVA